LHPFALKSLDFTQTDNLKIKPLISIHTVWVNADTSDATFVKYHQEYARRRYLFFKTE